VAAELVAVESVAAESVAAEERLAAQVPAACTAVPHADTDNTVPGTADMAAAEVCNVPVERVHGREDGTQREAAAQEQSASALGCRLATLGTQAGRGTARCLQQEAPLASPSLARAQRPPE
jgi:hypothetical protein